MTDIFFFFNIYGYHPLELNSSANHILYVGKPLQDSACQTADLKRSSVQVTTHNIAWNESDSANTRRAWRCSN